MNAIVLLVSLNLKKSSNEINNRTTNMQKRNQV